MLYLELAELDVDVLVERLAAPCPEGDEYAAAYYDDVAITLRARGQRGTDALLERLSTSDELRAASILVAFATPPRDESMIPVFRAYLDDGRPRVLLEVIDGLWYLRDRDVHDRIEALHDHASPYVRGAVLRYLSRLFPDEALPYLRTALRDPHFVVRESAVDEYDELDAIGAIDDIRPLLSDSHPDVRQAARTAIANLEGMGVGGDR
jgi:HEAT repeat protein